MHTSPLKILLLLIGFPILLFSQTNHGFSFDNYSGIYGVVSNPANSVDSKYNIHVNVLSYNQLGVSNIGSLTDFEVETLPNGFNGLDFSNNIPESPGDGDSFGHTDVLLPSVVWNFHEKYAVGLLLRSRSIFDYRGTNSALLKGANEGFTEDFEYNNTNLNNTAHSWAEVGINLSTVLVDANYHFLKFGGTFKYYFGNVASEVRGALSGGYAANELTLNTVANDSLISLNTYSESTDNTNSESFINSSIDNFSGKGKGIGGDIGIVYEWRPRETNRVDVRSNSGAVNKYKLKISASVLDIGAITYEDVAKNSIALNALEIDDYDKNTGLVRSIINERANAAVSVAPEFGDATFALPRSLHLNLDYIVLNNKNYYININYIKGLTATSDQYANTQLNLITVTPRYETRHLSVYLPVNFESTSGISAGLGVRYRWVTIGTAALSSMLTKGKMRHLYFGVSIPLMKELYR